jgi:hypothetical protein
MMDLKEQWAMQLRGFQLAEEHRVRDLRKLGREDWLGQMHRVHGVREPSAWLFQAALNLQRALWAEGLEFCFIGGIALQRWGEVRQTDDIDLTLWCPLGEEERVVESLGKTITSREQDVWRMARTARMYLGRSESGQGVDASLAFMPYERGMLNRAVDVDFGLEEPLHCCSAEDLAITKTVAGRGQDWVDLKRIIQRSGRAIDWEMVYRELEPLLEMTEQPESMERLRGIVAAER